MVEYTIHVLLTNVLTVHHEAGAVLESSIKVMWAHHFIVLVEVATFWNVSS